MVRSFVPSIVGASVGRLVYHFCVLCVMVIRISVIDLIVLLVEDLELHEI